MSVTITDVAERAGVSPSTVSRVLNGHQYVAEATKKRVLQAMDDLGYYPNLVASALTTKKTNTLAALVPDLRNPFFADLLTAIEASAAQLGYSVIVCNTDDDPQKEARYFQLLRQKAVDGVIIAPSPSSLRPLQPVLESGMPVNFVATDLPTMALNCVRVDDFRGGYEAAIHLLDLGHRELAFIAEYRSLPSSEERIRGYRYAIEERGASGADRIVEAKGRTIQAGMAAAKELLAQHPTTTAVFCANDLLAIGLMHGARMQGLSIPDDLSVVGFDGTILASAVYPSLTTIVQPIEPIAESTVKMIDTLIRGEQKAPQRLVIPPTLQVGGSTGPCKRM